MSDKNFSDAMTCIDYNKAPTYEDVYSACIGLCRQHNFLQEICIGKTLLRKDIPAIVIGNPKNCTLFAGCFHSLEWLTSLLLLRFLEDLCKSYKDSSVSKSIFGNHLDCKSILEKRGLIVVPCVNCDGMNLVNCANEKSSLALLCGKYYKTVSKILEKDKYALKKWQANIRGVDLNHNYKAGFKIVKALEEKNGIYSPCPSLYGGKKPHSEPETKAMVALCEKYNFAKVFAYHSQGEEIYYSYDNCTPASSKYIADILGHVSGYRVCHPTVMASHGGFKDWFIFTHKKPGFTFEIGCGKNPLPCEALNEIYKDLKSAMALALVL